MSEGKVGGKENSKILLRNIVTSCESSNYVVPIDWPKSPKSPKSSLLLKSQDSMAYQSVWIQF